MNPDSHPTPSPEPPGTPRQPLRVILVQPSLKATQMLADFFTKRGDYVLQTSNPIEASHLLEHNTPGLVIVDIHLPGNDWIELLRLVRQQFPNIKVLATNRYPDLRREILAKEQGAQVFLRQPYTRVWIERALARLGEARETEAKAAEVPEGLPPVRVPFSLKVILPYVLLALVFASSAAYLVSRYVLESFQERFTNQLLDSARLSKDWMVQEESRLLETLRLLANTQGVSASAAAGDADQLRVLAFPVVLNDQQEAVEIVDLTGTSLLSMRHRPGGSLEDYDITRGENAFPEWEFVRDVLARRVDAQGDKFAGVAHAPWGDYFYVTGPIIDDNGELVGLVLVGTSLETLVRRIREDTLAAHITLYEFSGSPVASTLFLEDESRVVPGAQVSDILNRQNEESYVRDLTLASVEYSEILSPWEARGRSDLGLIGSALTRSSLSRPTTFTQLQAFLIVTAGFLLVILLGLYVAYLVTHPLMNMVQASAQVAQGNLEVKVEASGGDELAVLGHAFNYMVSGLQEGSIYRDLLGRTVSPAVREELRVAFASGNLRLEGQSVVATVLMSDIRGFTTLSEKEEPTTILAWLNEYFGELVPIITSHGGVVDKFEGDAVLAFFGILPQPLPPSQSAQQACQAAVEMLAVIESMNNRRAAAGRPPFVTGIGINTGLVTAGGLGAADRLDYTVVGDAVNTAQRLEGFTRQFGESGVVVSEFTHAALQEQSLAFNFETLGAQAFKGKTEEVSVYRLLGLSDGSKEATL